MKRDKCVFLDRDGTLIQDKGYVYQKKDLTFLYGVPQALKILKRKGFKLIVITNQSGVSRGYFTLRDVHAFHQYMNRCLRIEAGVEIDDFFVCPHLPSGCIAPYNILCDCRKPKPGLIYKAMEKYPIDISASYMVGDKLTDIWLGYSLPLKGVYSITDDHSLLRYANCMI